jgi:ribulose-5-phosphate 4-epimerase/fuculose-1-phosphate aldolase
VNAAESIEQLKHDLALASRILDVSGATSAFGHISVRLPGEDAFLLSCARAAGLVRPDDILVIGLDAVDAMGNRNAILLKWHGAIVVGPSLYWTCLGAVQLEFAARIQYQAHQIGRPSFFPREHTREMYEQLEGARDTTAYYREWDYWVERVRAASGDDVFRLHGAYGAHGYHVPG